VSSDSLPEPLTPADCDLRDFQFMPVDIVRLFNSEFHARSSDSEWRAGMTLWLKSYHQIPAASIPDDDTALARLAEFGRDVKAWKKIREMVLYGWVKCSDGRLYHPVVAEKVLEAWIEKLANSLSGAAGNAKRWSVEIDTDNVKNKIIEATTLLQAIAPRSRTLKKKLVVTIMAGSPKDPDPIAPRSPPDPDPIAPRSPPDPDSIAEGSQGTGTGTGTGTGILKSKPVLTHTVYPSQQSRDENENNSQKPSGDPPPAEPQPPPGKPTPAASVCLSIKKHGIIDVNPAHPELLMLIEAGATIDEFVHAARTAKDKGKGFAYVLGIVKSQRAEALQAKDKVLQGDLPNRSPPVKHRNYQKYNALDAINGGDGYGNKQAESEHGRIIDIGGEVVGEESKIQKLISN
jgi:hypothetical protein